MSKPGTVSDNHNERSLQDLLAHVDEQCRGRCEAVRKRAYDEAGRIRRNARDRAADLLREARRRERRLLHEKLRKECARQEGRIRQRQLDRRRVLADEGIERVRAALARLWRQEDQGVRTDWLVRVLADARRVVVARCWTVCHPGDWTPDAQARSAAERTAPGVEIKWRGDESLPDGFVVYAGRAVVDASANGLTARADRIAGVLLAELPAAGTEIEE